MELYQAIFQRKSIRKYDMTPLSEAELQKVRDFTEMWKPLYSEIKTKHVLVNDVKNLLPIKAPHYWLFYSNHQEGYLENAGFLLQQMDLFLSANGLGSCWLGMAKPWEKQEKDMEFVMVLAFGKAAGNPHRELREFQRKALSEIAIGEDARLECARLAPSATNSQQWYFVCAEGRIHCYQRKLDPIRTRMYGKMNRIDMGIAICHLYLATEQLGREFSFQKDVLAGERDGFFYIGTAK